MYTELSSYSPVFMQFGCNAQQARYVEKLFSQVSCVSWFEKLSVLWGGGRQRLSTMADEIVGREPQYIGRKSVPLSQIQGSCNPGRCEEFDADFSPCCLNSTQRWYSVAIARLQGKQLPPIRLVEVDNSYFVSDGHHRVSVASAFGDVNIEADVIRC
ncbi:MAG: hypothetical protein ACPG8W_09425 [Candidatus Promineifilaceae bacterium]